MSSTKKASAGMDEIAKAGGIYLSVVIRVRNEAKSLRRVLEALRVQRCSFVWEIIIVDNESEDETVDLCKQYNAHIIPITREEWTYGRASNRGISNARGQLVLLCSAHSIPVGSYFLESAIAPFTDPDIAAARCLFGSNNEQTAEWYMAHDIQYESFEEQQTAEASLDWLGLYPSAICCVIRRAVWQQIPFDEHHEGIEDKLWAREVLRKGHKIKSCAEAVFIYNRHIGTRVVWKRANRDLRTLYRTLGYVPLRWPKFFAKMVRAALLTPFVGLIYFVKEVVSNTYLVSIPWQAKSAPRVGSLAENQLPIIRQTWGKLLDRLLG
jgi:glycosyltransferase involved in cell wall biosynthesis